ncbi:HmuY family protein [Flavobacterium piscisymbiosum]|uniref:HmuY family protein n=1 Tax=Flavobacterium piscisymbiosum TaxID=2893753 RepID=A0ABS8M9X1_9FLAO|nr:HmuY family protein [Flavobacterium sp. F-30]MCC9061657.1 HmuY family protein [Flavobacterium sp. F-30]
MKTNFLKLSLLALVLFTASCSSDDDKDTTTEVVVTTKVSDLNAPQTGGGQAGAASGEFTRFSFSENKIVTTDKWDIAFRGTVIIVNGGVKVNVDDSGEPARTGSGAISTVSNTFGAVTTFPAASTFKQDAATVYSIPAVAGQGWYNYANTIISPIAGKVFVVKTHDGKYAKFEILSYYKGAPATPAADSTPRYYTFNFAYQANSTTTF